MCIWLTLSRVSRANICGVGETSWRAEVFAAVWAEALVGSDSATAVVAAKQSDQPLCMQEYQSILK